MIVGGASITVVEDHSPDPIGIVVVLLGVLCFAIQQHLANGVKKCNVLVNGEEKEESINPIALN